MTRRIPAALTTLAAAAALAACGGGSSAGAAASSAPSASEGGTVTVLAAASLTEAFTTIADGFEAAHPGTEVEVSFGASSDLAAQITAGAPADVFASASPKNMTTVTDAGYTGEVTDFAANRITVAVPAGNPAGITGIADLADAGVKVAVCDPEVPCGVLATEAFEQAGVDVTPVTEEEDVKGVLTKVRLGEVDAGLVYTTDVLAAADEVAQVALPDDLDVATTYPIATLTGGTEPDLAAEFVAYVLSDAGQQVLAADGFAAA